MTDDETACPISGDRAKLADATGDFVEFDCPTCGRFRISRSILTMMPNKPEILRHELYRAKWLTKPGDVPLIANVVGG